MIVLVAERVSGSILAGEGVKFEYRHLRYFTLEHSSQTAGETDTVIGE